MTEDEKAMIVLESLEEYIQIDWAFEKFYIKAIKKGFETIREEEQKRGTTREDWIHLGSITKFEENH